MDSRNFFNDTLRQFQQADEFINNVINQYIVKPSSGTTNSGIGGFVFDVVGDEELVLESDITDHFVEPNFAIEDHIARKPERFTLRGYQGEVRDFVANASLQLLAAVQSLGSIGTYPQPFTAQAAQQYAKIAGKVAKVTSVISQARSIYDIFIGGDTSVYRQQAAFKYFYTLWASRMLCDIETPWMVFTGMAIENVRILQRDDSRIISEFSVTFKKIRVAQAVVQKTQGTGGPLAGAVSRIETPPFLETSTKPAVGWKGRADQNLQGTTRLGSDSGLSASAERLLGSLSVSLRPPLPPF